MANTTNNEKKQKRGHKQLKFTYNDKEYTLEFTRKSVEQMEKQGFIATEIENKPATYIPMLFAGAFLAHHRFEKKQVIDEIYANMTHKDDLIAKLAEMYNDPIMTLIEEPDETEGNISWTPSF